MQIKLRDKKAKRCWISMNRDYILCGVYIKFQYTSQFALISTHNSIWVDSAQLSHYSTSKGSKLILENWMYETKYVTIQYGGKSADNNNYVLHSVRQWSLRMLALYLSSSTFITFEHQSYIIWWKYFHTIISQKCSINRYIL